MLSDWLPTTNKEVKIRGWDSLDVIIFSGDAYVDHPIDDFSDENGTITATLHYDYTFCNSLLLQFETLYNGFGGDEISEGLSEFVFMNLSPKNLFPTKVAFFSSGGYQLSPLFYIMPAGMYGPQGDFLI